MAWLKFKGDQLFDGSALRNNVVLVMDEGGRVEAVVDEQQGGDDVQYIPGILTPGFINGHCHLELSHMKGAVPEGTGLVDFVIDVVGKRGTDEALMLQKAQAADEAMWQSGIAAVGDICNNAITVEVKKRSRIHYHSFIELSGWVPAIAQSRVDAALRIAEAFKAAGLSYSFAPHAPYSVSRELWEKLSQLFTNDITTLHHAETPDEPLFFREGRGDLLRLYQKLGLETAHHQPTGKSSLQSCFPFLKSAAKILLVHNSFTPETDLQWLQEMQQMEDTPSIHFCLCANANQYIERAMPPIEAFRKWGVKLLLGTDSLASNASLSIASEMKTILQHFPQLPLQELLHWATLGGAQALQLSGLGSFERGTTPGLVTLDTNRWESRRIV